jgi:hypothetical protein
MIEGSAMMIGAVVTALLVLGLFFSMLTSSPREDQ